MLNLVTGQMHLVESTGTEFIINAWNDPKVGVTTRNSTPKLWLRVTGASHLVLVEMVIQYVEAVLSGRKVVIKSKGPIQPYDGVIRPIQDEIASSIKRTVLIWAVLIWIAKYVKAVISL